ncbi:MAG: barstar family protein [Lysobacter sp.]
MTRQLVIDGDRIHDIVSFYDEINRVFMADVDWSLAHSLDALDDMLYGGYGALDGNAPATLVWTNYENNRRDLGPDATHAFLLAKLDKPATFDSSRIQRQLDALDAGTGQTFFDTVLEIIASHPNITLQPQPPASSTSFQ